MKPALVFVPVILVLLLAVWGVLGSPSAAPALAQAPTPVPALAGAFPVGAFDVKPLNAFFTTGMFAAVRYSSPLTLKRVYLFKPDGTLVIHGHSLFLGTGKYTATANQFTVLTPGSYDGCAADQAGTYTWSFDGKTLSLADAQDVCEPRKADLTGGLVKRADVPPAAPVTVEKMRSLGTTKSLTILPLVETVSSSQTLSTTFGVSYLVKTDTATILFDVGNNPNTVDPSPLLYNMQQLGVKLTDVNVIAISHAHFDHTGGPQWHFNNTLSLGNRQLDLAAKRLYVPEPMTYPGVTPIVTTQPAMIAPAVATLGNLPMNPPGFGDEESLAVNVEGKGIVLISGCGHATIQKMVERAQAMFDAPIVGFVGGLHYQPADIKVFQPNVDFIKGLKLQLLAVSPHDTNDLALAALREAFPETMSNLKVGQAIKFGQ